MKYLIFIIVVFICGCQKSPQKPKSQFTEVAYRAIDVPMKERSIIMKNDTKWLTNDKPFYDSGKKRIELKKEELEEINTLLMSSHIQDTEERFKQIVGFEENSHRKACINIYPYLIKRYDNIGNCFLPNYNKIIINSPDGKYNKHHHLVIIDLETHELIEIGGI